MNLSQDKTENVGGVTLDLTWYGGEDLYSDGDVEEELLTIAREHDASEFPRIIAERKSWPILYHLSHLRGNILKPVQTDGTEKVLEIGAGCGAVTGTLAEKAGRVDCVELSKRRSLINANRNRGQENLRILVGNFETIEPYLDRDYDIVTLIGVFEYASYYLHTEDPFRDFLKTALAHLRPGGRLYIAIENRLGLKYFAGCREDHSGELFEGIEGYAPDARAHTFSRSEWVNLLESCGCMKYTFYYPYPDYKFPTQIFSDARLPQAGELNRNRNNFDRTRLLLFDEEKVWESMIAEGTFPQFSNSFLIEIEA